MVRTKADAATARVSGAKAPRKIHVNPSATAKKPSSSSSNGGGGGNPYCPRETPKWQKEITKFFQPKINEGGQSQADDAKPNNEEQTPDHQIEQIQASNSQNSNDEETASSEAA
ncbi:Uncharacterized protein GBIM_16931 [Gryllus bimaculatus]|nr:Uncharacterized protein GBIM_16931 [Gryllus bimaculatus]